MMDIARNGPKLVFFIIALVAGALVFATRDMNFAGSDEEMLYLPATKQIASVNYLSELAHSFAFDNPILIHGKEIAIWHFSQMQRLLGDFDSIRPLLWTVILAWALSAWLIFAIAEFYWGTRAGWICFFFFVSSFWPYVYVLLVKHQPVGLFYFLAALRMLQQTYHSQKSLAWAAGSGALMAASLYASTVSVLYLPLYGGALWHQFTAKRQRPAPIWTCIPGFAAIVYIVNYPHVAGNIREFLDYVQASRTVNHFSFHQNILRAWIEQPAQAYGGWLWTFKFLLLAMPFLFPVYLLAVFFGFREHGRVVILSFIPIFLANVSHVAQYGGNYFPCFIGMLMLIGYLSSRKPMVLAGFIIMQVGINALIFFSDVLPARMASANLSRELREHNISHIYLHTDNPVNEYLVNKVDPQLLKNLKILPIENITQPQSGHIVVAPIAGSSIYLAMIHRYSDFDRDIYLNELVRRGTLKNYAVASFKTMASSPIWRQEEEMLSYRDLILNQFSRQNADKAKLWLLDAGKLFKDRAGNAPSQEYTDLVSRGIRNIGTRENLYRYKGLMIGFNKNTNISHVPVRLFKIGSPQDRLTMYVYKRGLVAGKRPQIAWVGGQASLPVDGKLLTANIEGQEAAFRFDPPLLLPPGQYHFVIYRTGPENDKDFYRIYIDETERSDYISAVSVPASL